ncbi:MAG: response regulator, partial [Lachnospiraceae bacterium]|nr:response regulator [Lachnospiraceae bacterium]
MRNKVLVVDDQEMNRDLLEEILIKDYDVVKVPDGKQALEKLGQKDMKIVAVLLDLLMPEMDGFAVLDAMHEQGMLKKIPVLVISSEQTVNVEEKCFEYGVSDFIHKPFEPSIIQSRVKNNVNLFLYKERLEDQVAVQTQAIRYQYQLLKEQAEKLERNNEE